MRKGTNSSKGSRGSFRRVGGEEEDGDGEMYMSGGLGDLEAENGYDWGDGRDGEIIGLKVMPTASVAPVERFRSLRGYGYTPRAAIGGRQHPTPDEQDEADNDARFLRPGTHSRVQSLDTAAGPGLATAERRVRWREEDEVRYYPRRSHVSEDSVSSLYSGEGYGPTPAPGHDSNTGRRDVGEFRFAFKGGEA
jgi:hypothetical protein